MKRLILMMIFIGAASAASANESPEALMDAFMTAVRANDAEGLGACYTEDAVNFPLSAMKEIGPEAVAASWQGFFDAFRVTDATLPEKHLETHGDTAIAWGLFRIVAEPVAGGEAVVFEGRFMDVSRNIDGSWLYVADHASIPLPSE